MRENEPEEPSSRGFDVFRREYDTRVLLEESASPNAIDQFAKWFDEARQAKVIEPNVMTLATADEAGTPSARIVLLKGLDQGGFVFFTNYGSRKGLQMDANPRTALVFFWQPLERQVRIEGKAHRVTRAESEAYFRSRPRESQIGAWVSSQSSVVESRHELDRRKKELEARFEGRDIPLPDFWGGYRVVPTSVEFWQGRPGRLHDRLLYSRQDDGSWKIQRLEP